MVEPIRLKKYESNWIIFARIRGENYQPIWVARNQQKTPWLQIHHKNPQQNSATPHHLGSLSWPEWCRQGIWEAAWGVRELLVKLFVHYWDILIYLDIYLKIPEWLIVNLKSTSKQPGHFLFSFPLVASWRKRQKDSKREMFRCLSAMLVTKA